MEMQSKEILPGIEIFGLTLWLKEHKTLVFADLHLGYEEELNAKGFLIPRFQFKDILRYFEEQIFSAISPEKVIINGDLKHEFGKISEQEWEEVLGFLDFLEDFSQEIILIKGNHDTILGPLAERKELGIRNHFYFPEKKIYLCHGHQIPEDKDFSNSKIVIIAHDHPAVSLREEMRVEKIKCFLKGEWNSKTLIQLPSLNFITEGTTILQEKMLSPFMQKTEEFEVYGVEEGKIFHFGKAKNL